MSNVDSRQFDPQRHGPELSAYVDNELSGPERAEVERLLAESPAARAAMAELREMAEALRSLPREPSPIDFAASVRREGLAKAENSAVSTTERTWRIPFGLRTLASAAVLAICVSTTWRIMLPPAHVTLAERLGREPAPSVDSLAARRLDAGEPLGWPAPAVPAPGPAESPVAAGRGAASSAFTARRSADAAGYAVDRRDDLQDAFVPLNESAAGLLGVPAGSVQFDDAGNRLTNFGRVYIPTQTTEQYNAVRFTISAIERSVGQAPSYLTANDAPTVEEVQLRVPVERAPEVLSLLNDMVLPEQVRVELNVLNDESSFRQLQMLLSQAMSQPGVDYAFAASQPVATLGTPLKSVEKSAPGGELEGTAKDESAAVVAAAPRAARPRSEVAGTRGKQLDKLEEERAPVVAKSATRKESGEEETADRDAARESPSREKRAAAGEPAAMAESKLRRGGGAGGGRGFAGGGDAESPQAAPVGGDPRMNADARMQQPRGERVTALITRGQAVWNQLSNSASTIVNRFGEITQSNRRQSNATGDLLMFEVTILPPPQTTQPAAGQEIEPVETPASDTPR